VRGELWGVPVSDRNGWAGNLAYAVAIRTHRELKDQINDMTYLLAQYANALGALRELEGLEPRGETVECILKLQESLVAFELPRAPSPE